MLDMNNSYQIYSIQKSQNDKGGTINIWQDLGEVCGTVLTTRTGQLSRDYNKKDISTQATRTQLNIRLSPKCIQDKNIVLEDSMFIKENFGLKRTFAVISYFVQPDILNPNKIEYYRLEVENYTTKKFKTI